MKLSGLLLACVTLAPIAAWGGNFSYDYTQIDYLNISPQTGENTKGPDIQLSYTIPGMEVQLLAGYTKLDTPATPVDLNSRNYRVGIRGESSFGDDTDFYTDLLYLNNRVTYQTSASTENGYRLLLGMRHKINTYLEFDGSLAHDYLDQTDNEVSIGLLFKATNYLSLGAWYAHDTLYNNTTTLGVRLYF